MSISKIKCSLLLKWPVFLLGISLLMVACRPDPLIIDVPQLESQLVVASQFIPEEFVLVSLSKSFSALVSVEDDSTGDLLNQLLVQNAKVALRHDGQTDSLVALERGFYFGSDIERSIGSDYFLEVEYEGERLSSRTTLLNSVGFDSIGPLINRSAIDTLISVKFRIKDPSGDNWFMMNYYINESDEDSTFSPQNILGGGNSNGLLATILFSDKSFDSNGFYESEARLEGIQDSALLAVSLSNISEDYYNFLVLRQRAGNIFSQIVSEPINYPTNVDGGLGYFTLHFPSFEIFDLSQY